MSKKSTKLPRAAKTKATKKATKKATVTVIDTAAQHSTAIISPITLNECFDESRLHAIMQDELLYKAVMEEGSPPKEDWTADFNHFRYLLATDGTEDLGYMSISKFTYITCWVHSSLLSKYWGVDDISHKTHKLVEDWILENTGYLHILAPVPKQCGYVIDRLLLEKYIMQGKIVQGVYFNKILDDVIILQKSLHRPDPNSLM